MGSRMKHCPPAPQKISNSRPKKKHSRFDDVFPVFCFFWWWFFFSPFALEGRTSPLFPAWSKDMCMYLYIYRYGLRLHTWKRKRMQKEDGGKGGWVIYRIYPRVGVGGEAAGGPGGEIVNTKPQTKSEAKLSRATLVSSPPLFFQSM